MSPHKIHRSRLALKKAVQPLGRGGGGGGGGEGVHMFDKLSCM